MPTVPTKSPSNLLTQKANLGRITATPSAESFGGGESTSRLTNTVKSFIDNEINKVNQIRALKAENQYTKFEVDFLADLKTNYRGEKAFEAADEFQKRNQKTLSEIEKDLSGPQVELFRARANDRINGLGRRISEHTTSELLAVDQRETDNFLKNQTLLAGENSAEFAATGDDSSIRKNIQGTVARLKDFSERNGLGNEWLGQEAVKQVTATHAMVISRLVDVNRTKEAKDYLEKYSAEISPESKGKIEDFVKKAHIGVEANQNVNEIMQSGVGLTNMLAKARSIEDQEIASATTSLLKTRVAEEKQFKDLQDEDLYKSLFNQVTREKSINGLNKAALYSLKPATQKSLMDYADSLIKGPSATNSESYFALATMAGTPETREKFLRLDILKEYGNSLSEPDREKFIDLQVKMRKKDPALDVDGLTTKNQIFTDLADSVDQNILKDPERRGALRAAIDIDVVDWLKANGKEKMPNEEYRKIVNKQLMDVYQKRSFIWDKKIPLFESKGEKDLYIPYDKIPVDAINDIALDLEARGVKVTKDLVRQKYIERLTSASR